MAKQTLPVNFKDDIPNASMNGKRRYRMIQNADGTVSFDDVTAYDQVGSNFGAGQINQTNAAVNASADASKIIDSLDTIKANTQKGYIAGALAVKELDISSPQFIYDSTGKITGYKTRAGADTVFPFTNDKRIFIVKKGIKQSGFSVSISNANYNNSGYLENSTPSGMQIAINIDVTNLSYMTVEAECKPYLTWYLDGNTGNNRWFGSRADLSTLKGTHTLQIALPWESGYLGGCRLYNLWYE